MTRNPACAICGRDDLPVALTSWDGKTVIACSSCTSPVTAPSSPPKFVDRLFRWVRRNPGCSFGEICEGLEIPDTATAGDDGRKARETITSRLVDLIRAGEVTTNGKRPALYTAVGDTRGRAKKAKPVAEPPKPPTSRALKHYRKRVKERVCPGCRTPRPPGAENVYCDPCLARRRAYVQATSVGRCTRCRCSMLPEWGRYKMCPTCREQKAKNRRDWRKDNYEHAKAWDQTYYRKKRAKQRAERVCFDCGAPTVGDSARCADCGEFHRQRINAARRAKRANPRANYGCSRCGARDHNVRTCTMPATARAA